MALLWFWVADLIGLAVSGAWYRSCFVRDWWPSFAELVLCCLFFGSSCLGFLVLMIGLGGEIFT